MRGVLYSCLGEEEGEMMIDPVFLLRCIDCDAKGGLSRLWIRVSLEMESDRHSRILHYVECLNCGAHLKSQHRDLMEIVDDEEWRRFVDDDIEVELPSRTEMQRLH